ncbi:BppU family phage baseplate upper protein [Lachnospiraceae bacterium 45-W7]
MTPITYHLTLDLKRDLHQVLVMKEGDANSRIIKITITDNGENFILSDQHITVKWKKPDQCIVENDCQKSDESSVSFTCSEQMLMVPGIAHAELCMFDKYNHLLSTMPFQVSIKNTAVTDSDLASSNEFQTLVKLLDDFRTEHENVKKEVNAMKDAAQDAREQSESFAHGNTGKRAGENTDNAQYYKEQAGTSSANAQNYANNSSQSAISAANSASSASSSAAQSTQKATEASSSAALASTKAQEASDSATRSKSYAVGGTNTRTGENTDNSKYYYEQSKRIAESFAGALRPMGTVTFSALPALSSADEGDMYNISNQFTTTTSFEEGSGNIIPAGSNIYKTANGKWDVLAGSPVTGVKGNAESSYKKGNVNITPASIGLGNVNNTADANKNVASAKIVKGTYTANGGAQAPSYVASGTVRFNMMNAFKGLGGLPGYLDCILMDTYTGNDVPYVTGLGIYKGAGSPRAFIASGAKGNSTTWAAQTELITSANVGKQTVAYATKAAQDDAGNVIQDSYVTKKTVTNGNFNTVTTPGIYTMTNCTNSPESGSGNSYGLAVLETAGKTSGTYITQIAFKKITGTTKNSNMNIRYGYVYSSNSITFTAWEKMYQTKNDFLNLIYPVGSIYMSVNTTNPSVLFGGTWERWGNGRVAVGVNTSDAEFNTVEKTGGAKTHTLTVEETPSHYHSVPSQTVVTTLNGGHQHDLRYNMTATVNGTAMRIMSSGANVSNGMVVSSGDHTHSITIPETFSGISGSYYAHNNLQPYITCYMWKRTA